MYTYIDGYMSTYICESLPVPMATRQKQYACVHVNACVRVYT